MRTVDAALTAGLASGRYRPYMKAYIHYSNGDVKESTTKVYKYILTGQTLDIWVATIGNYGEEQTHISLERGLKIAGTTYTVTTGRFWIWSEDYLPNQVCHFKGGILPRKYYSDALTDDTYETVIDNFFDNFGKTVTYVDEGLGLDEDWLDYQFLPNPSTLIMSNANRMLAFLAQKRLLGCADNGDEDIRVFSTNYFYTEEETIPLKNNFSFGTTTIRRRQLIWRDEDGVAHQSGTATDPVHNYGFYLAAEGPPTRKYDTASFSAIMRPDLRWQDGDTLKFTFYDAALNVLVWARVIEEWDYKALPHWTMKISSWPVFNNSEGAELPSAVAHAGNYAHVNASNFDGYLSEYENNIQTALDALDDHPTPDIVGTHLAGTLVGTGATRYTAPFMYGVTVAESQSAWPHAGTLSDLTVRISSAQPATGSLVITLRINGASTAVVVTIPAGSAAGTYQDTTNSVALAANDLLSFMIVNNAGASSAAMQSITVLLNQSPP